MGFRKCVGPLLLMGLLTACGNGTPSGGFHPSGTAPADPTAASSDDGGSGAGTSSDSPGAQGPQPKTPQSALAAYRSYQLAYEQAYANNDPSLLDPVAMNPLLKKLTQDMAHVHAQGFIWRFHNVLN